MQNTSTGKKIIGTFFITVMAFISVAYTACKKTETTPSEDLCASITCQNGGNCFKGKCSCPGGFEGEFCEIKALNKFTGSWTMTEKVTGTNRVANSGNEKQYSINISAKQGSNVDFVINNFMGSYDNVPCRMGMNDKQEIVSYRYFGFIPATVGTSTIYIVSGEGHVNDFGTYVNGSYIRTYPDNSGIVNDTLSFTMER